MKRARKHIDSFKRFFTVILSILVVVLCLELPLLKAEPVDLNSLFRLKSELKSLVSQVSPHVVQILVEIPAVKLISAPGAASKYFLYLGSGVIRNEAGQQLIVTAESLVREGEHYLVVDAQGREGVAMMAGKDFISNIAVLKYNGPKLGSITAGDMSSVKSGDGVLALAIGSKYTRMETSYRYGRILSVPEMSRESLQVCRFMKTNIQVNSEYSGAPMFDTSGNWIGLIVGHAVKCEMRYDRDKSTGKKNFRRYNKHLSLAVPINTVEYVVRRLLANKQPEYGCLGVSSEFFSVESGAGGSTVASLTIKKVHEGSAAEKSNIKPGDKIIQLNGRVMESWYEVFTEIINCSPGQQISMILERDNKPVNISVNLDKWGESDSGLIIKDEIHDPILDVTTQPVQIESRGQMNPGPLSFPRYGVKVCRVNQGAARKSGLRSGDIIVSVQGRRINSPEHFRNFFSVVLREKTVDITYIRDGSMKNTKIYFDKANSMSNLDREQSLRAYCGDETILPRPFTDIHMLLGPFRYKQLKK